VPLSLGWRISHQNVSDGSVEGLVHTEKPAFSVQYHPEGSPGPDENAYLFEKFVGSMQRGREGGVDAGNNWGANRSRYGSGPIIIGQAAEFDYAGTQACRALREEGVRVVLVNSNPATIMTDDEVADRVYIEPLTVEVLERVIERERPYGILPTLGGQTGLNLAVELANAGVLERWGVRLLGTPLHSIREAEDRDLFRQLLQRIDEPSIESVTVHTVQEGLTFAAKAGLPLISRPAYTLGGTGGGMAASSVVVGGGEVGVRCGRTLVSFRFGGRKDD
jgi:hypothetical protein